MLYRVAYVRLVSCLFKLLITYRRMQLNELSREYHVAHIIPKRVLISINNSYRSDYISISDTKYFVCILYVTKIWINRCFYIIVEDYFSYLLYLSIIIIDNMNKNTYN